MEKETILLKMVADIQKFSLLSAKDVLTLEDVALLTGYSKNYLRTLMCRREIPFYRPEGRKPYFSKEEINRWLLQNHVPTQNDVNAVQFLKNYVNS